MSYENPEKIEKETNTSATSSLIRSLVLGYLSVMALIALTLSLSYQTLLSSQSLISEIVDTNNQKIELIRSLSHITRERLVLLHQMLDEKDAFKREDDLTEYYKYGEQFILDKQSLELLAKSEQEWLFFKKMKLILVKLNSFQLEILDSLSDDKFENVSDILRKMDESQHALNQVLGEYIAFEEKASQASSTEIKNIFSDSKHWMLGFSVVIVLIGGVISFLAIRFVMNQRTEIVEINATLESYNHILKSSVEDLSRANKSKSEFIANMSHELRTPMTAIKGSLGILDSGMIEGIPEEAKNLITMADNNTDRLIDLVTDVLDFSKLEAGEIDIVVNEFNIHYEIEKFLIPYYKKARNKALNFKVSYSKKLPQNIKLDQTHLFQILTQLLNNALKFTEEGKVSLLVDYSEDTDNIVFHIIDTGIGFDDIDIQFLFESFVQGDGSSTRKHGGTGIGLAICRKLVDALKGEIKVSSEKDEGSTFSLSIPVDIAA